MNIRSESFTVVQNFASLYIFNYNKNEKVANRE